MIGRPDGRVIGRVILWRDEWMAGARAQNSPTAAVTPGVWAVGYPHGAKLPNSGRARASIGRCVSCKVLKSSIAENAVDGWAVGASPAEGCLSDLQLCTTADAETCCGPTAWRCPASRGWIFNRPSIAKTILPARGQQGKRRSEPEARTCCDCTPMLDLQLCTAMDAETRCAP